MLKYFICCSKDQKCFDLLCIEKLWRSVYFFVQLKISHLKKKNLSHTVFIPSMHTNFVKADCYIRTSHIPTLKLPPCSILNHIQPWIQTFSLLFINENNCLPCFLYITQDDYGVPFFQNRFTKEGLSALMQLLATFLKSTGQIHVIRNKGRPIFYVSFFCRGQLFVSKYGTVSYKNIYN